MYLFLTRSVTWSFGWNSNKKRTSILDDEPPTKDNPDQSPPLISNKDLLVNVELSKNLDERKSLVEKDRVSTLPPANALSALGKYYLTREDLENMIQTRMKQETPRDRVERFLWKE